MLVAYYYICKTLWKKNNQLQGTQKSAAESSCQGTQEAKSCTGNSLTVQNCNDLQSDTSSINRLILHNRFIENIVNDNSMNVFKQYLNFKVANSSFVFIIDCIHGSEKTSLFTDVGSVERTISEFRQ